MTDPSSMTAAQRVLSTAELIAEIVHYFVGIRRTILFGLPMEFEDCKSLLRCSRVNTLWFAQVMRFFWQAPTIQQALPISLHGYVAFGCTFKTSLLQRFSEVNPDRRQFYADFVIGTNMMAVRQEGLRMANRVLQGITFPKLGMMCLYLNQHDNCIYLPHLDAPSITYVHVHAYKFRLGLSHHFVAWKPARSPFKRESIWRLATILKVCLQGRSGSSRS
ncbi:uncharacterized protein N7482_005491 [Penicillium canariense]|uniref:Uncharacterized protein n=1 Tax=Penicillium canariense TaxID=189055 RepID=A0A9W9I2H5_9EURO|nr:uncharacterized protein N7482_005491 [Penicillium canariense]KAJ5166710.1 hypothetical protein N7482_005491 [Penicillium canariense]